jgi:membrane-bound lytic murein transglycosylase F
MERWRLRITRAGLELARDSRATPTALSSVSLDSRRSTARLECARLVTTKRQLVFGLLAAACLSVACKSRTERAREAAPLDSSDVARDPGVKTAGVAGEPAVQRDWASIKARDTITAIAAYNSTTYFIYRGEPMGYEYDLLKQFASDHGLALKVIVVQNRDSMFALLRSGKADIVANRLVPVPEDSGVVAYTRALYQVPPVVVQRKNPPAVAAAKLPKPADTLLKERTAPRAPHNASPAGPAAAPPTPPTTGIHARIVQRPADLAGRRVTVPQDSPFRWTLLELSDTITGDIRVVEMDSSSEALIRSVSKGTLDYTVAQGNLAELQGVYFKNLLIRPVIGDSKKVAWAVRRTDRTLLDTLNAWISDEKRGALFERTYKRYFVDSRAYLARVASRYLTSETGTLSAYDGLLREYAAQLGWDWRLLGSQMYQESRVRPNARSWAGAVGLLQLMPATAKQVGVRNPRDPEQNVRGAVKYLQWLEKRWTDNVSDPKERLKFVLASYNAGSGHVEDAQRLAVKHGDNPKRWDDVSYWLLHLSESEYYTDPVVEFGFCRGLEPVTYVSLILDRFAHYQQFVVTRSASAAQ